MKEAILRGELLAYAVVLKRSWTAKKQLATGVTNPAMDAIYEGPLEAGALAGKISGARGGGFFILCADRQAHVGTQDWHSTKVKS